MERSHLYPMTVIRRSCLTGKAVWIYSGSYLGLKKAYFRARREEVNRVRSWQQTAMMRRANITRLLNDCLSMLPINAELTSQQQEAVRQLQAIGKRDIGCYREFYNHIMEGRFYRNKGFRNNKYYDK